MPPDNDDPFAGADDARNALAGVTQRLRDYHHLDETQTAAARVLIDGAVSQMASGAATADKVLAIVDKVAGFIANPKTLLALVGL